MSVCVEHQNTYLTFDVICSFLYFPSTRSKSVILSYSAPSGKKIFALWALCVVALRVRVVERCCETC
jgi:hypothetical protein